ncbi:hypothetical protein [Nocardiopsis metallicus]|uniref:Uncharacterized protein n=1 Tax=Nocardiopsis metallicus TaxID=179819 RepID=A0A840WRX0_9ACTN|nr:hypothetical protein [Nocardiopsis metallicus]MBB5495771.1 hypothetical protein [Nocardiopsis metallicus]
MAVDLIAVAALGLLCTVTAVLVSSTGRSEERRPARRKASPQTAPTTPEETR